MNEEKKARITLAAIEELRAFTRYQQMGMMNSNVPMEEREKSAIAYALSKAAAFEAQQELVRAIES